MRRAAAGLIATALVLSSCSAQKRAQPLLVGAVYPLSGSQGSGGIEEFRGVRLAVDMVNADGGVQGRTVELRPVDTPGSDAVPEAISGLQSAGVRFVLGSYGSTISAPAAAAASRRGMLFWETGAVGEMSPGTTSGLVFRVPPTGLVLGRAAIDFVAKRLAPRLRARTRPLRFAVANVNDTYGRTVAKGAVAEIHRLNLPVAGVFPYDPRRAHMPQVVSRIAKARPDVLFVAAYLDDGVALRRETVRQHLHLVASIGTSSSYCMPMFGAELGANAVGLFASDKPDANALDISGLRPDARALLLKGRSAYRRKWGGSMTAPALSGFSAAWALFHGIAPRASALTPTAVARTARQTLIPDGGLPNGSGLRFASTNAPDPSANLRAQSVIWEWVGLKKRAVVWPPRFATSPIRVLQLAS